MGQKESRKTEYTDASQHKGRNYKGMVGTGSECVFVNLRSRNGKDHEVWWAADLKYWREEDETTDSGTWFHR